MKIPYTENLHSQSFNSTFIEFVWQFPISKEEKNQIIFKVFKDNVVLLEEGIIDESGEYKDNKYLTSGTLTTKNISYSELSILKEEVVKYLNEEVI